MSWNAWEISMALFPVLRVFWQNNMASMVENTSWNPLEMDVQDSKFQNVMMMMMMNFIHVSMYLADANWGL